jgi:hypothetical protein
LQTRETQSSLNSLTRRQLWREPVKNLVVPFPNWVMRAISAVRSELDQLGLKHFQPLFFVGDEWFAPEGGNSVSIPFFLLHRKLREVERDIVGFVEGGSATSVRKLLRHEIGHCFDHVFGVRHHSEFFALFGDPNQRYRSARYTVDSQSTDFVENLPDNYAQAHPLEDFAETFAVYLEYRGKNLGQRYAAHTVAAEKLAFVAERIREARSIKKPLQKFATPYAAWRIRSQLHLYYKRRLNLH